MTAADLLIIQNLTMCFGGLVAVDKLNLEIKRGEIVSLIGPNGAGKTTVFNCITSLARPTEGSIELHQEKAIPLVGRPPHEVITLGIARTFQNIRLFPDMTVLENVLVGNHCRMRSGILDALLHTSTHRAEERESSDKALEFLKFVGLAGKEDELARNLPYADGRRLEIARALASSPQLLLLDEPAAGMNPKEKEALMDLIAKIREHSVTLFLIEHDMKVVMGISDRVAVMDFGEKIAEGTPPEIQGNPAVIEAYLGPLKNGGHHA